MSDLDKIMQIARANPHADPKTLARRLVASLSRAALIQLIAEEIAHAQRRLVREVEADALDALFAKARPMPAIAVATDDPLRLLFGQPIAFGIGHSVLAEHMTLEQWVARRAMLVTQQRGIGRAIEICDAAIARIQSSGVNCLAEIGIGRAA